MPPRPPSAPPAAPRAAVPARSPLYRVLWFLLQAMLPISAVLAVLALFVGLTFGFNLWRWDRPLVTVAWLVYVLLPVAVYRALQFRRWSLPALAVCVVAVWAPPLVLFLRPLFSR